MVIESFRRRVIGPLVRRDQKVRSSPFRGLVDPDHNPALIIRWEA
jgi:hypothetical protein